jgi:hypothetical protein
MSKSWRSPGPYSVNTQGLAAGEDYLIRNLEEIKKGYYKEEGRREAHVDQRLTNLEQRSDMVETALAELKKNLSIVLAIGGLINGLLDWLRARGGVKKI